MITSTKWWCCASTIVETSIAESGTVDGWPILVASQAPNQADYRVAVRASVRRGRLPDALRVILFWNDGWQRDASGGRIGMPLVFHVVQFELFQSVRPRMKASGAISIRFSCISFSTCFDGRKSFSAS